MAAASTETEFFALLEATGVNVRPKTGPSGDTLGYSVALPGDLNKHGEPVWFSGSTLAGDLSLPKIRHRLTTTAPEPVTVRSADPWHQATAATERIPHHLTHSSDHTAQGQLVALGEALDLLPLTAPAEAKRELERAATAFERATRSRITADLHSTRVLRRSIQTILLTPATTRDGTGLAMLLDAVLIAVAFARHWHQTHQHAQQEAAAEQTLTHLQTAYAHVAVPVLDGLVRRTPGPQTTHRYARHLQQAAPEHADRILKDPAWHALATVLADAETAGHNPATLLDQALGQRTLDDARNPARTLTWRIHRLGQRHTPGPRAQAAMARSTTRRPGNPIHPETATPAVAPQQPHVRRR